MSKLKLAKLANIVMGQSPQGETCNETGNGIPLLNGPSEFTEFYPIPKQFTIDPKKFSSKKSILFCVRGSTTGRMNWSDREYAIGRGLASITHKKGAHLNHFLRYLIQSNLNSILKTTGGSTFPNLTSDLLASFEFEVPELQTQQKISNVLSALDTKIELNNRINAELEAMAKTLYDYWFVQFEFPFDFAQGKPNPDIKPYKSSGGKMAWNEELKREIPEGWEVKLLGEWINNDKSGDWGKENPEGNYTQKVYCIRGADINGMNGTGSLNTPERYILEKNLHKILELGDLVVEISGGSPTQSTGRLAFVMEETLKRFDAPIICSNFCKAVTLKDKKLLYNFVYNWNSLYDAGILFGYEGKTSGIKNLLFESFVSTYMTIMPNKEIAYKFYGIATTIHSKKQKNLIENQRLSSLRDWLLPMLMNGQVTVNEQLGMSNGQLGISNEELGIKNEQFAKRNEGTSGLMAAEDGVGYGK